MFSEIPCILYSNMRWKLRGQYNLAGPNHLVWAGSAVHLSHCPPGNWVMTSTNLCQTDEDPPHGYTQIFVLKPEGNTWFIQHDVFRLALHHVAAWCKLDIYRIKVSDGVDTLLDILRAVDPGSWLVSLVHFLLRNLYVSSWDTLSQISRLRLTW